ncbi:MAG: ribbon-helix-helix domain-containing protein [Desulfurococcales archaeon]|nr:ribbon-helix-helix domain-containing protein [Desulfurococcales archaeon]
MKRREARGNGKSRFGISIDKSVAERLSRLAEVLGVDRSRLVEEAVRQYLDDHKHMLVPHECRGIIVGLCPDNIAVASKVRDYKDIVSSHMHIHIDGKCIDIIVVQGPSRIIGKLYASLEHDNCKTRFLPLGDLA